MALLGVANACMWAPTQRHRHPQPADDGRPAPASGVYNTTRQVGAVLGSAGIAVLMQSRLAAERPAAGGAELDRAAARLLPAALRDAFSTAMADSMLLPAAVLVVGLVAVLFFARPRHQMAPARVADPRPATTAAASWPHGCRRAGRTAAAEPATTAPPPAPETVASR